MREIVQYAADRFITVVPEIELPGHCTAAVAACPELGNDPSRTVEVATSWGVFPTIFNVEDATLDTLRDVLDEVMELFPSPFIHIGGDECPHTEWARSGRALARMIGLGLVPPDTTLAGLQDYRDASGRLAEHPALAEVLWSPAGGRDFQVFSARLRRHLARLDALDVGYHPCD